MILVESILTRNPCFTAGKKIKVMGLMLHSVGCPQPDASVFINGWNDPAHSNSCVHGFIDGNDGMVYQTLPWDHRAWHCGSGSKGSGNNTYIGVEMCEPDCIKYTDGANFICSDLDAAKAIVKRTYESAVELFATLCKKYCLDPLADGVVISHREGHDRGIASNHGDPEHLWAQLGMEYTMDGFRRAVKETMDNMPSEENGRRLVEQNEPEHGMVSGSCATGDIPFLVRVSTPYLNIRKGPGVDCDKTGRYTGIGTFTIVAVRDGVGSNSGWGLLKAYAEDEDGWIALDHTERA